MQRFSAVPAAALEDRELTDSEYRTLAAIALYADKQGWCYPSQSTIAELRGLSRQMISSHIRSLKKRGYLNVQPRYREDGGRSSNLYQVRLDYPPVKPDLTGGASGALQGMSSPDFTGDVKPRVYSNTPINTPNQEGIYIRDDDPLFFDMVSALSVEARERLWDRTEESFYNAAEALRRDGVEPEQVQGFRLWWKENGHYNDHPALTSIMQSIDKYLAGETVSNKNGQHHDKDEPAGFAGIREYLAGVENE